MCLTASPFFGISQQNVVATGGNASGVGGSLSYSIGQIDYQTVNSSNHTLTLGVQQPYEIYTLSYGEELNVTIACHLYPNPTTNGCFLKFEDESIDPTKYIYILTDAQGKTLSRGSILNSNQLIDFQFSETGELFLSVWDKKENQKLRIFKIVKL